MPERALELADLDFLHRVQLFSGLRPRDLASVRRVAEPWLYGKGEQILWAEQTGQAMYVLVSGQVKVVALTPEGKEVILALHGPGDFFGEMALIDHRTSPADVVAMVPSKVLIIRAADFHRLLGRTAVRQSLMETLCTRCRSAWDQLKALAHYTTEARLRAVFLFLAERFGVEASGGGTAVDLELSHKVLADLAGVTREQVTRAMGALQTRGLLVIEASRRVVIPDLESLALGVPA
jgi:CRP/FNR family transcriptional regulator